MNDKLFWIQYGRAVVSVVPANGLFCQVVYSGGSGDRDDPIVERESFGDRPRFGVEKQEFVDHWSSSILEAGSVALVDLLGLSGSDEMFSIKAEPLKVMRQP